MSIGERIRELRKKSNLNQAELAEKAGISRVALGNYERGERVPSVSIASNIATAFGVSVNSLLNTGDFWWEKKGDQIQEYEQGLNRVITQLTPDEIISLMAALNKTIDYSTRADSDEQKQAIIERLASIINFFGEMVLQSFEMPFSSVDDPNEYLIFLRHYERITQLMNEHKKELIDNALARWKEEKNKSELYNLIYGGDPDAKKD